MNGKEITLIGVGILLVAAMGYVALKPQKKEAETPPNSAMDGIGGVGLIAGSTIFLLFVLAALAVVGIAYGINQASKGDIDQNITRAGRIKDVIRR